MGEVLSQNEIDSLLQALSTGELDVDEMKSAPEKSVKNYDFKRPEKAVCFTWKIMMRPQQRLLFNPNKRQKMAV